MLLYLLKYLGDRSVWMKWVWDRFWQNVDETSVQSIVGFRPLIGSRVASVVRRSVPATLHLVSGRLFLCFVFYCASASQRWSVDSSYD
ncbi:hypothetical protein HAX54_043177, partial [Datura stramonium]|nr:hypothetical protein [Datura stramonium]